MEEKIKQRLIGVLVLIGSLFIILPFLFHNSRPSAEQKTVSTIPNGATPPAVSVTLPAENTTTPDASASVENTAPAATTVSASTPATATTPTPTATTTASPAATENTTVSATTAPSAAQPAVQTQKPQMAQAKTQPAAIIPANSSQLNSNTIASRPDASGFKADQAVSPTSGLTTGVPISTPSTTEAMSSSSAAAAQPITESISQQPVAHHKHAAKTAHHPHHAMHAMSGKKWEIQLAVFSNERNAKQLMTKLHAHHFAAHTRRITHHGRHMTAVFVGPEFNHRKMMALQNHLHHEFHLSGVVKQV